MKPSFVISVGAGWSATTPLWYTLQVDNQFVHAGLEKESKYLDSIIRPVKKYNVIEKIRHRNKGFHKDRLPQVKNDIFLTQEDIIAFTKPPFTLDKYITYYRRLWETLQENDCSYQGVSDFSNVNAWLPKKFCYEVVERLSEYFDVKVLLIVRDPIRRLWSEIGGYWSWYSTRQWKSEEEHNQLFFDFIQEDHMNYFNIIEKWEKICPFHVIIMEQLWEGDQQDKEKKRLSDFLDYDIKKIHENAYSPDRGLNAPQYLGLIDQWTSDKYLLREELYNQVKPLFSVYDKWIDKYGSLPLYWGKPYNYE